MPLPTSQKNMLDLAITAVNNWYAAALANGVTLTQVNMSFPPPAGDPDAPNTAVVFSRDVEAGEFRVDT